MCAEIFAVRWMCRARFLLFRQRVSLCFMTAYRPNRLLSLSANKKADENRVLELEKFGADGENFSKWRRVLTKLNIALTKSSCAFMLGCMCLALLAYIYNFYLRVYGKPSDEQIEELEKQIFQRYRDENAAERDRRNSLNENF